MSVNYAVLKDGQLRKYFRRSDAIRYYDEYKGDKLLSFTLDLFPTYTYIIKKPNFDIRNLREDDTLNVTTFARRKANKKYDKANTLLYSLKLNKNTDSEIIDYLANCENKQGLIKRLLREEVEKNKKVDN